jgi:tol-pal system protein YbgF
LPKSLLAAAATALLLSSTSAGQAAWPWQKPAQQQQAADNGSVILAQADTDRLNRVEQQMRTLTGQIEELTHQLQVLQDQLKKMQDDNEYRFGQLEGGAATKPAATAGSAAAQAAPAPPAPAAKTPAAQVVDAANAPADKTGLGAPPKPLGQVTLDAPTSIDAPPAQQQPLDLSSLATGSDDGGATAVPPANNVGGDAQVASLTPSGDARTDYDQAYKLVTAGRYDIAESAFRQFLATYPNDELAPDAQYWLGESLYAHGDYAAAAEEFKAGYQKYPKSRRAPDSLLKLGLSMAGLDYRDEACKMYALALKQYPQMSNGLRSRVKAEQASASCS